MNARPTVAGLVRAEVRKLASRASVRLTLAALAAIAIGTPLFLFLLTFVVAPTPEALEAGAEPVSFELATVLQTVLWFRNFFLFRAGLIAVVAVSFAGEFVARTLREDLVRPVSRGTVMLAKWSAIQVLVAAGVLLPLVLCAPLGLLFFGAEGELGEVLFAWALTWLGDVGFATLVVAISTLLRSVPGTIGGVFLYWVVDRVVGWGLYGVATFRSIFDSLFDQWKMPEMKQLVDVVVAVRPWLPSSAFDVAFEQQLDDPFVWQSFAALAIYTALSYALASWVFGRVDVD